MGKESAHNAGDKGCIPGSGKSPGGRNGNLLQQFLPGKSHAQRNLASYSPEGHKELDMTEATEDTLTEARPLEQSPEMQLTSKYPPDSI